MSPRVPRSLRRGLVLAAVTGISVLVPMTAAQAACQAFTVTASPTTAAEGGQVLVTVHRDAALNPSAVDVSTVDGSAKSGQDFAGGRRTISFTTETQKSFPLPITNDRAAEPSETFQVALVRGSGSGCAIDPNFTYGPPVRITIQASDQSAPVATPSASPARPTATAPANGGVPTPPPTHPATPGPSAGASSRPASRGRTMPDPQPSPTAGQPTPSESSAPTKAVSYRGKGSPPTAVLAPAILLISVALAGGVAYVFGSRPSPR
jgi:hypothetical protein